MFDRSKRAVPTAKSTTGVDPFRDRAARTPAETGSATRGRLIFALDATASRQPTWDLALDLQSRMFEVTQALGGLDVQLVYFRGLHECRASPFVSGGTGLGRYMRSIRCEAGVTQIGRVLNHARDEAKARRVGALVFVGDALEERTEPLRETAGELALLGTKAFVFQEGSSPLVRSAFKDIARITGGAYGAFDRSAPDVLAQLLAAAAAYAAGGASGLRALASRSGGEAQQLLAQISGTGQ